MAGAIAPCSGNIKIPKSIPRIRPKAKVCAGELLFARLANSHVYVIADEPGLHDTARQKSDETVFPSGSLNFFGHAFPHLRSDEGFDVCAFWFSDDVAEIALSCASRF